jgi:prolyl-tRNA synthetase
MELQKRHCFDAALVGDAKLKDFKATVRNIPLVDEFDGAGKCIVTGDPVERRAVIAKAY